MSLLDKFNSIEVKADTRISEHDREFCVAYHEAYVKGRLDIIGQPITRKCNLAWKS